MPLTAPPTVNILAALPTKRMAGLRLHRVYLASRPSPWFFASLPPQADPYAHGRFDLPHPDGACYISTSAVAAVLETFQHLVGGLIPDQELRVRARAEVVAPTTCPPAANLTAARARGAGVTAALWADHDRVRTQAWADQLRRAGHRALFHGIGHDPTVRLRGLTLFDKAGEHPPYDDAAGWRATRHAVHNDSQLRATLGRYGLTVTRSDPSLPLIRLDDSGLL